MLTPSARAQGHWGSLSLQPAPRERSQERPPPHQALVTPDTSLTVMWPSSRSADTAHRPAWSRSSPLLSLYSPRNLYTVILSLFTLSPVYCDPVVIHPVTCMLCSCLHSPSHLCTMFLSSFILSPVFYDLVLIHLVTTCILCSCLHSPCYLCTKCLSSGTLSPVY